MRQNNAAQLAIVGTRHIKRTFDRGPALRETGRRVSVGDRGEVVEA